MLRKNRIKIRISRRQRTYSEVRINEELTAAKPCSFGRDYKAFLCLAFQKITSYIFIFRKTAMFSDIYRPVRFCLHTDTKITTFIHN